MTDPDSPRAKIARNAWVLIALAIALTIVLGFIAAADLLGAPKETGVYAAAILAWDALVFRWGVNRFDITPPKPLRDAQRQEVND